jgi:hypothetical protein
MVGANVISGLALLTVPLAYRMGHLTALQVVLAALISQSAFVFYDAANFGFLLSLVGRDRILAANGFLYSSMGVLGAIGPAFVGLTVSHIALSDFILFDAVTFLASALLLGRIPRLPMEDAGEEGAPQSLFAGVAEGVRYFRMNAVVGRMTLISALQTAANGGVMSVLVVWVSQAFRMSATDSRIGLYYVAIAVSGVAAGKIATLATRAWSSNVAMKILVPLSLVLGYAMLLVPIWWVAAILLGLSSGLGLASVILAVTLRQQAIPDALQSRVNTLGRMLAFGLGYTVGAVIAGSLGQAIPIEAALAWVLLLRVAAAGVTYLPSRGSLTPADEVQVAH